MGKASFSSREVGPVRRRLQVEQLMSMAAAAVRGRGAAVLLCGEPGTGKTTLLDCVAAASPALRSLRSRGFPSETALPYAALTDLLLPLQEHVGCASAVHRSALEVCLAVRFGDPPDPRVLAAGVHGVLAAAAAVHPLLLLVDDVQWLDPASRQVLGAVAPQLHDLAILMIMAARPSLGAELPDLPAITLSGRYSDPCRSLLCGRRSELPPERLATTMLDRPPDWPTAQHPQRAVVDLVRAAEAVRQVDPSHAADLYVEAAHSAGVAGRVPEMLDLARRADSLATGPQQRSVSATVTRAAALTLSGATTGARLRLDEARALADGPPRWWDAHVAVLYGQVCLWLEEHESARRVLDEVVDRGRAAGPRGSLPYALAVRAELAWWSGEWTSARTDAIEALRRAEELRQVAPIGFALVTLARLEMSTGELREGQRLAERALSEVGAYSVDGSRPYVHAVLGFGQLAAGEAQTATEHLEQARRAVERCGLAAPTVIPFGGDLVEAHIRAGHDAQAATALCRLAEQAAATGLVFPAAAAARCGGLLADNLDRAREQFATAALLHRRRAMPFEQGRTLLCEGETLRRLRRPVPARAVLAEALGIFTRIGARPWAARARLELDTTDTGAAARPRCPPGTLTPREFQIAQAVVDGRSNAEVASALFISRRTVEAHLSRIYGKLGVRSRTELARRVVGRAGNPDEGR